MDQIESSSVDFGVSSFSFMDSLQNVDSIFCSYVAIAILSLILLLLLAYLFYYNNYYNKECVEDNIVNGNDINDIQRQEESKESKELEESNELEESKELE